MTYRIALSILLTVWATLIAGGVIAYATTRSVLLADLDESLVRRARGLVELAGTREAAPRLEESAEDRYVITGPLGRTLGRLPLTGAATAPPEVMHASLATLGDGSRVRSLTLRFTPRGGTAQVIVVYSASAQRFEGVLHRLAFALIGFGAAAGAAAAGVAVWISRTALRPLRGVGEAIGAIDDRKLDRRIDPSALPPELHPVAGRLNDMLERLERAFLQRRQFLADASHELRTPVAALVITLEVALRRPRDAAELTAVLQTCLSDARLLRQLVQTLLEHARSDTAVHCESPEMVDAAPLLNQCADVADGLALGRDVSVRRAIAPSLELTSQPQRLRGIVTNLLGNAVEHNRPGGWVELRAQTIGRDLEICVSDNGPGIAAEHVPHLFEPFYRASDRVGLTTAADDQHLGLGLFLVDSHVKALGGECRVESEYGVGTVVRVRLPGAVSAKTSVPQANVA